VVNQVTTTRVVSGEQIISDKITAVGSNIGEFGDNPPLSVVVTSGLRGTSIEVNSIVGAGGNIRPGDKVDVILSVEVGVGEPGDSTTGAFRDQISAIVLQDLQVLAIDTSVSQGSGQAPEDQKDTDEKATTATLLATPSQAEVLVLADACRANHGGRIGLAVRSYGDAGRYDQRTEWPAAGEPPSCAGLFGLQYLP
jgi:pilus assembly protein CpaB